MFQQQGRGEGDAGVSVCPGLTLPLLSRSVPGEHLLGLVLTLAEPAAAEPGHVPRALHRQPSARCPRTVRTDPACWAPTRPPRATGPPGDPHGPEGHTQEITVERVCSSLCPLYPSLPAMVHRAQHLLGSLFQELR